ERAPTGRPVAVERAQRAALEGFAQRHRHPAGRVRRRRGRGRREVQGRGLGGRRRAGRGGGAGPDRRHGAGARRWVRGGAGGPVGLRVRAGVGRGGPVVGGTLQHAAVGPAGQVVVVVERQRGPGGAGRDGAGAVLGQHDVGRGGARGGIGQVGTAARTRG